MNLYRLVMRHFWWKITSILVATILWVAVRWDMIEESQNNAQGRGPMVTLVYEAVPILVLKKASETNQFILNPASVRVKVKANSSVLEEMDVSEIRVIADLINRPTTNVFNAALRLDVRDELEVQFFEPRNVVVQVQEPSRPR
jgi:YbbR domain-containing protein